MKKNTITPLAILLFAVLMSCGGTSNQAADVKGFEAIEKELKSKFGADAYYTDLSIGFIDDMGLNANATVTEDPNSLKMGEWSYFQNTWKQNSEITLEISEGSKASDFMYQLNDDFSIKKLGELVEKSSTQLTKEKSIENPKLNLAHIMFPDNGDVSKAKYSIQLKPESGGTSFNFYYTIAGEFIDLDY